MFEIGKRYTFVMLEGGEETERTRRVERYEHPLLKLEDVVTPEGHQYFTPGRSPGHIINVTSPNFVSAVLFED